MIDQSPSLGSGSNAGVLSTKVSQSRQIALVLDRVILIRHPMTKVPRMSHPISQAAIAT